MQPNEKRIREVIAAWSRLDRTTAGAKTVDLPCTGVFLLEAGKIKIWRDYFDMATYQRAVA